jgi:type I restriction enzyme S subunit
MVAELQAKAHGSVFDTITRETFSSVRVPQPSSDIAGTYEIAVSGFMEKIANNLTLNQTLAQLRDTLLPKLMSGEIRVNDAGREVGVSV